MTDTATRTRPTILVVDDDDNLRRLVAAFLEHEGFDVREAADGDEALRELEVAQPDLIVLDVMLPGTDGLTVAQHVARRYPVPVLMLTALNSEEDVLDGFEAGADDYLAKPFSPKVLVAHVRAILRRGRGLQQDELRTVVHGDIEMDLRTRAVVVDGQEVGLTATEFDLLRVFLENPGWVFSREELLERVWDYSYLGDSRTVDVHVGHLRRKIGDDPADPAHILTVRGCGYRLRPAAPTKTAGSRFPAGRR